MSFKLYASIVAASLWVGFSSFVYADSGCNPLHHNFGPFDYRTQTKEQLAWVEGAHFFPNVENLRDGTPHPNRGYAIIPGGEIDYTLRVFPNHPRALLALSRLSIRDKTERPRGVRTTVDCYFKLGMEYRPDDANVVLIYGIHLVKKGRVSEALEYFDKAKALGDDSANLHYNLGLAYFQAKRFDDALEAAHKAYAAGFPLMGLKNMLIRSGKWTDIPLENPPAKPAEASVGDAASVEPAKADVSEAAKSQ